MNARKRLLEFDNHCRLLPNHDHLSPNHRPKLNWIYPVAIYYFYSEIDKKYVWVKNNHLSNLAKNWKARYHKNIRNFRMKVIFVTPEIPKCTSSTVHLSKYLDSSI